jgi:hypothetical protein
MWYRPQWTGPITPRLPIVSLPEESPRTASAIPIWPPPAPRPVWPASTHGFAHQSSGRPPTPVPASRLQSTYEATRIRRYSSSSQYVPGSSRDVLSSCRRLKLDLSDFRSVNTRKRSSDPRGAVWRLYREPTPRPGGSPVYDPCVGCTDPQVVEVAQQLAIE